MQRHLCCVQQQQRPARDGPSCSGCSQVGGRLIFCAVYLPCCSPRSDLTEATLTGAWLSIVAAIIMAFLFGMVGAPVCSRCRCRARPRCERGLAAAGGICSRARDRLHGLCGRCCTCRSFTRSCRSRRRRSWWLTAAPRTSCSRSTSTSGGLSSDGGWWARHGTQGRAGLSSTIQGGA